MQRGVLTGGSVGRSLSHVFSVESGRSGSGWGGYFFRLAPSSIAAITRAVSAISFPTIVNRSCVLMAAGKLAVMHEGADRGVFDEA